MNDMTKSIILITAWILLPLPMICGLEKILKKKLEINENKS